MLRSMADLEPTPDADEKKQPSAPAVQTLLNAALALNKSVQLPEATEEFYALIAGDRPIKFQGSQVGFKRQEGRQKYRCGACWHLAVFPAPVRSKEQEGACEIMRPEDGNVSVNPSDVCRWFTPDGMSFPLRDGEATDTAAEPEGETKPADSAD